MNFGQFKGGIFLLEALNAVATALYLNYLFFFLKFQFGFTGFQNLLVCALNGFIYMLMAYPGGRFGQRRGYMKGLAVGVVLMGVSLAASLAWRSVMGILVNMVIWTIGMCFTWPTLEALTAEKESPKTLLGRLGVYNVVWAGGVAIAYFSGGAILGSPQKWERIFWIPVAIHFVQLLLLGILTPVWHKLAKLPESREGEPAHATHPEARQFLKMAWLANPFAYIAMNAAIPLFPELAARFQLTTRHAGYFCSVWFFARMGTFILLALWPGWHYRFGYLLSAYIGVIVSFAAMLLLPNLWLIVAAQVVFGWCVGVIYYSSLYYSMDAGSATAASGEHGGVHEAVIGIGIFGGPAMGAISLYAFPAHPESSVWGVALVLCLGLGALLYVRSAQRRQV